MKDFNWKEFLKKHPFCWSLKDIEVDKLLQEDTSKERNFPAGTLIVKEGEVGDSVFLIGSGSVQILLFSEDGLEIPLKRLERGEFFGEMAILENRPRAATVKAIEDSTLLEINGQGFLKLLMEHPEIEFKLLLSVSDRLRELNRQVIGANIKQIDEKLKSFNMRLDVELKTVDASLKASQAFFDQTKLRTDEIINSTERSRTRQTITLSAVSTIVGIVVAILGFFGFSEVINIREEANKIEEVRDEITQLADGAKHDLNIMHNELEQFSKLRINFYREIMIPTFQKEIDENTKNASEYLKSILETKDPTITDHVFDIFVTNIFYLDDDDREYSKEILADAIKYQYLRTPDQTILSYYLILSALVLDNTYKGEEFAELLKAFKEYVREYEGPPIKESIRLESLKNFLVTDDFYDKVPMNSTKKEQHDHLRALIP